MSNYGFRISQDGYDVKTCNDKECVITSKYTNLKGAISGGGSKSVPDDSQQSVTIAHNLGYIPFAQVYVAPLNDGNYILIPFAEASIFVDYIELRAEVDSTNLKIYFLQDNSTGATKIMPYKYFIFLDKGKL